MMGGRSAEMRLGDFIPPILFKVKSRFVTNKFTHEQQTKAFGSFDQALAACDGYGYENDELVNVVCEKTRRFRDRVYSQNSLVIDFTSTRSLLALQIASKGKKKLRVIDFGGACGTHYFVAKAFFRNSVEFEWTVVETRAMAGKGRALEDDELRFSDSLSEATQSLQEIDLVYSSGALQYVPSPLETLHNLLDCNAEYLFLTRLALIDDADELSSITTIQTSRLSENGPGPLPEGMKDGAAKYPITFVNKRILETRLRERYHLLLNFEEGDMVRSGGRTISGVGYFAIRL
jgi:putative methyltransferase (TIGR04325 family)